MTPVDAKSPEIQARGNSGMSVFERMRLTKAWDETLNGMRVVEGRDDSARSRQERGIDVARSAAQAPSGAGAAKLPLNRPIVTEAFNTMAERPEMTPSSVQSRGGSKSSSEGPFTPVVAREPSQELDDLHRDCPAVRGSPKPRDVDGASEPIIRLLRGDDGLTVLIAHPSLVTPSEISRFVAEVRQSTQSMPVRLRSIRLNGHEVYSDARPDGVTVLSGGLKSAHAVDVKF